MGEVDPADIQDVQHRPELAATQADGSVADSAAVEGLEEEKGEVCENWGFFAVVNRRVAVEKRERIERAAREFFGQGSEEKKKVRRDEKRTLGYNETKHTKNVGDWRRSSTSPCKSQRSSRPRTRTAKIVSLSASQWPEYPRGLSRSGGGWGAAGSVAAAAGCSR
ncbi:uncharacterized protein J3R85_011114 [Psidium guajava]|nr:uncharacterized protein J3R85_011114 [Psidium guajava]